MRRRLVLIDSSAWISHLTDQARLPARIVDELLRTQRVACNVLIRLEVLTGARDNAQYAKLQDAFQGLPQLPLSDAVWRRAERMRFWLRRAGHVIPVPDVVIASCAIVHDCELLHTDRHFDIVARTTALKVHPPTQ